MKMSEVFKSIFKGPVAVEMVDLGEQPTPTGRRPLVIFSTEGCLSVEQKRRIRQDIEPYAKECEFDFLVVSGGMTAKRVL